MPILETAGFQLDYSDTGKGPVVILVHSAASNNRQWRQIIEEYQDRFRFLAINLFGYGKTSPWPAHEKQSIDDQVQLVDALIELINDKVVLVGHSFGGTVAAFAARKWGDKVSHLVLLEANPFPVLERDKRIDAMNEVLWLKNTIFEEGKANNWEKVAHTFVDYWLGEGSWQNLNEDRQETFISTLPNNLHEWDAVTSIDCDAKVWQAISADTLLLRAKETRRPVVEMYEVLRQDCPHWHYDEVSDGGHMAPMTRPDLVNPKIISFLG